MQMLVYENYSKFITATDTIRNMKDNVEAMGSGMEQLLASVRAPPDRQTVDTGRRISSPPPRY